MAITETSRRAIYGGNGIIDSFPFAYKIIEGSDVSPYKVSSTGTITLILTNYTVIPNANQDASPGGSVTYPNSGTKLQTGEKIILLGNTPEDQELDLTINGDFDAETDEDALDKLTMLIHQHSEILARTVVFPLDESPTEEERSSYLEDVQEAAAAAAASAAVAAASQAAATASALASAASAAAAAASAASVQFAVLSGLYVNRPANPAVSTFYYSTDRDQTELYILPAARWSLLP